MCSTIQIAEFVGNLFLILFFLLNIKDYFHILLQVDEATGFHQKGHWGYCEGNETQGSCPIPDTAAQLSQSINYLMRVVGKYMFLNLTK